MTPGAWQELTRAAFSEIYGDCFEHSPHFAVRLYDLGPFSDWAEVERAVRCVVFQAPQREQEALIQAHPRLGQQSPMSALSSQEQRQSGLANLDPERAAELQQLTRAYEEKHGFPFILCVHGKRPEDILASVRERLNQTQETEFQRALEEICCIALQRLKARSAATRS
ncbi:MAG: 2-oxo-4-hydroxy-4-carboxy-5-ureidoimidazoline decarboxylase [Alicyclobacillus mali]|uniref:2-oxo-4-hydroxy-4-carboxy-5-ureidoimidazoline decarboxylase n=1 Tax=Alicyclobacillus mali (ex Roth et al. 2021) TaxID=1123961 RepID=UPI0023F299AD|nr:2-oxo-4-hydroxy-4-carboxy-5-ureidoimidazoline decarboxylase [Alicyclobacillus mali (ex Roth et al. 2021)]MCL6489838.1 2-oxo-4-hydroxy-4-carboxy-5-ureidoimidazoline decarboxylase [Alicyclobacillus mali (ex Roth et al. 2021)]